MSCAGLLKRLPVVMPAQASSLLNFFFLFSGSILLVFLPPVFFIVPSAALLCTCEIGAQDNRDSITALVNRLLGKPQDLINAGFAAASA